MKGKVSEKYKDKFCLFHNAGGYTTATCFNLKDEIEYLIRRGKLTGYRKYADRGARNLPNQKIEGEISTISRGPYHGGESQRAMKEYAREVRQGVFQVAKVSLQPP